MFITVRLMLAVLVLSSGMPMGTCVHDSRVSVRSLILPNGWLVNALLPVWTLLMTPFTVVLCDVTDLMCLFLYVVFWLFGMC